MESPARANASLEHQREEEDEAGDDIALEQELAKKVEKVVILPGASNPDVVATFEIRNEDHTLGNALRVNAMLNPNVSMSAYNVPHPLETKMHLRIETLNGETPTEALKHALDLTISQCDNLLARFDDEFKSVQ